MATTTNTTPAHKPRKRWRRWVAGIAAVCLPAWMVLLGYVNWAMHQPPEVFGHVMAKMPMPAFLVIPFETLWNRARAGHLNPGDHAPGFTVKKLEGEAPVDLGALWASRPVVLVFGSYT